MPTIQFAEHTFDGPLSYVCIKNSRIRPRDSPNCPLSGFSDLKPKFIH
jgi:hypothetical protein